MAWRRLLPSLSLLFLLCRSIFFASPPSLRTSALRRLTILFRWSHRLTHPKNRRATERRLGGKYKTKFQFCGPLVSVSHALVLFISLHPAISAYLSGSDVYRPFSVSRALYICGLRFISICVLSLSTFVSLCLYSVSHTLPLTVFSHCSALLSQNQTERDELLKRTQAERAKREEQRRRVAAATRLQAVWRKRQVCRQQVRCQWKDRQPRQNDVRANRNSVRIAEE